MCDDVCLGEVAGGAEPVAQLVVEAEVDVDAVVTGAVEWARRRLADTAGGLRGVAEEHELGALVLVAQNPGPGVLGVVKDEGDELLALVFLGRSRHRTAGRGAGIVRRHSSRYEREKVPL